MMQSLDKDLRSALEKTVKAARAVAETAANAAVDQLGVGQDKPEAFLSDSEKALRNRLRTHGKQLGDARDSKSTNPTYGKQEIQHLVQEVSYEHWHRMLFARFLADNNLLLYDGVAVTIEECDELAPDEGAKSGWELAGKLAARMLPQVFKPGSPVFQLTFAPEHQSELERLIKDLPDAVFKATDSLGWVYQFWQADNKDRINNSEVKIGADELPAVTQLFTEPYMVSFLLHNTIGAWWKKSNPDKPIPFNLDYFRTLEDSTSAAGKFEGWPDSLAQFKLLDPCCGSGHFLVGAFLMLVPMRMAAEDLSSKEAINRVLSENIHGLELDPRCVEIAVFAVALEAWRYPDTNGKPLGVREIPTPHIACCGLKVAATAQDWEALVPDNTPNAAYVRQELRELHSSFSDAPLLGSLLDPTHNLKADLATSNIENLENLVEQAFSRELTLQMDGDTWENAVSAQGLIEAAQLLNKKYDLVITNVPYLTQKRMSDRLKNYCSEIYPDSKADIATVFLSRCLDLTNATGSVALVLPMHWLFLGSYAELRRRLLIENSFQLIARLGTNAFETIKHEIVNICLAIASRSTSNDDHTFSSIDVQLAGSAAEKKTSLQLNNILSLSQRSMISNPDCRITHFQPAGGKLLSEFALCMRGTIAGDTKKWTLNFWEIPLINNDWKLYQGPPSGTRMGNVSSDRSDTPFFDGMDSVLNWKTRGNGMQCSGEDNPTLGNIGVAVGQMGSLPTALYYGDFYSNSVAPIVPKQKNNLPALLCFVRSPEFYEQVRLIDQKINVTNATFIKVPFDVERWSEVAKAQYPHGVPKPFSNDSTQWIFHGHPCRSVKWDEELKIIKKEDLKINAEVLLVAVSRLIGYVWPAETDEAIVLADEMRDLIRGNATLDNYVDINGIVCIPSVGQESPASDRLLNLLAISYGKAWSTDVLTQLLAAADHAGKSLETWLRDKFFMQHCAHFSHRPFVWHIWDGLHDGFAALVNYHKLNHKSLEALIYTYLGDWINRQKRDTESGIDGAQDKLVAAEALKKRLELILVGEAPYDIFVRWKSIEKQPIGWNPDLNDGVRMNIRPFLSVPDVGKRGAGILRDKPNIKWDKDRGSDMPSAPWYELGVQYDGKMGDRINDHHLSLDDKRKARENAK